MAKFRNLPPAEQRRIVDGALDLLIQEQIAKGCTHPLPKPDNVAPEGFIWKCCACGKTAQDKYDGGGGWDEACMLNAVLMEDSHV